MRDGGADDQDELEGALPDFLQVVGDHLIQSHKVVAMCNLVIISIFKIIAILRHQVIINPGRNPTSLLDWDWKSFLETPRARKSSQAQDPPRKGNNAVIADRDDGGNNHM